MDLTNFNPLTIILLLIVVGLAPYAAVMVTSFTKLVVVMSLIRNALGVQSVPPNMVINGLALILTFFVMNPILQESFAAFEGKDVVAMSSDDQKGLIKQAAEPFRGFLMKHSGKKGGAEALAARARSRSKRRQPPRPCSGIYGRRIDLGVPDRLSALSSVCRHRPDHFKHPARNGNDDGVSDHNLAALQVAFIRPC